MSDVDYNSKERGSSEAIMMLVNSGADVAACDKDGLTALHCASSRGHVESAEALINMCGAEIDVTDSIGCSPLFYAVTLGHADCTQLLLESGAEPNRQDLKGRTAAHCGAVKGQFETIKILASHGANLWYRNIRGDLPLHEAIKSGRKELVRWLLQQLPSAVNTTNSIGRSPLHIAASDNNVEMCKVLIDSGSEINPLMKSKGHLMTPLDCALQKNYRSCAKFLLLHGALPASRLNLNSRSLNQKRLSAKSPGKGHVTPKVYAQSKSRPSSRGNFSSANTNSDGQSITNMESVEQHHDDGKTRTSITKRKVEIYRNNGSSPDYSFATSQSVSSGFQSQSIITNVYVNTVSKHKMAPLKRVKRRAKLSTSDSSQSSSQLNENQSQVNDNNVNVNRNEEPSITRKKGMASLSNKIKLDKQSVESERSTSRSRDKSKGLQSNKEVNGRTKLTSQSLDRATVKRGQINNKRSLIGKSIVKHPHASDVDLSVDVTEQVINSNGDDADNLQGRIESSESINNKGISESTSEADYSEDSQIEDSSVHHQETSESATGSLASVASLGSHELPILGSDDNSVDNCDGNGVSDEQVSDLSQELKENDGIIGSNKTKSQPMKSQDFTNTHKHANEDLCEENEGSKSESKMLSESRCSHRLHHRLLPNIGPIDLSHVTAKVDTRGLDLARRPNSEAKATKDQIKSETNEMMAKVERSLRKYQLERKIFQELQDLKRCQIRSGRVNEPVLVKRLVEKFRKEVKCPGMVDFTDSFTYRSYERFLYDQLRKLSSSNQGKVLPIIKSVSDENLALKFITNGDNQFNGYNDNHHIHHSHNQHLLDQRSKNGLRQKSVSAMSSFNQSKFKKDALPSVITNQRKEKFGSSEISKDNVIAKIYDNERLKSNKANTNNNIIITNNNNNINNNKNLVNVKSSAQDETELAKKIETSNIPILTRAHKTKLSELKQVKDHSMDKKSIRETSEKANNSELNGNQQMDKVKPAVGKKLKESGPLIVISSLNDKTNGKGRKVKIDGKDENKRKQDKELKKESVNCKEKVGETKKLIKRGPVNMSAREIRRTTAKHEQYKNLRGSHRRICLKSSDADSKPYVKAAIDRPKFKRCKSSIPARFKVNIPLQEIERRWRLIKDAERKKSAEQSVKREKQSDENGEPLEFLLLYEINQERKADEYDDAYDEYSYDVNYHVYSDGQDFYSDQETDYEDEADQDLRLSHLLKRTLSEPALLPRDLTV